MAKQTIFRREKKSDADTSIVDLLLNSVIVLLAVIIVIISLFRAGVLDLLVDSIMPKDNLARYSLVGDAENVCLQARKLSEKEISKRDPIYAIALEKYAAPEPDPSKYDEKFENYEDKTIEVHYHKEKFTETRIIENNEEKKYRSWFHFIEVRIKHPSQLRFALADDSYGKKRQTPSYIASQVNAVAAVNGCFYNRRSFGFLIYRREILRNKPVGLDVLLIDSSGNFHIVRDRDVMTSGVLENNDIVSALAFGPQLVSDGKALRIRTAFWEPDTDEPRTAICQYDDDLHYLICLCEGRNADSHGITMQTFADEIAKQGVKTAYNLDGGQSGTVILGNHRKNRVGWGPEKPQGDVLFFATALEEDERG